MKLTNYLRFFFEILSDKLGNSKPFSLNLDITDDCNFQCKICGVWKKEDKSNLDPEIFKEQLKNSKILRRIKLFSIGGGEPFLHPEVLTSIVHGIIDYSHPLQIRIVTNGFLTDRIVKFVKTYIESYDVPLGLKISLDGMENTHDFIRGTSNSYSKIIDTISKIQKLISSNNYHNPSLSITLGFTDTNLNIKDLKEVYELSKKLSVNFFHKPYIEGGKFLDNKLLTESPLKIENIVDIKVVGSINREIIRDIRDSKAIKYFEKVPTRFFYNSYNKFLDSHKTDVKCYAAKSSFFITPNGDVTPCLSINTAFGNINDSNFDEIWNSEKIKNFRNQSKQCQCLTPCDTIPFLIIKKFPFYF